VLLLVAAAAALQAGCGGSSDKAGGRSAPKPVVLTLAVPLGDSEEVDGFAGEVNRLSGGAVRIAVKTRWRWGQIGFENGLIRDVQAGKADLGVVGSRAWDSVGVTSFRALGAPLLIDSYALQERVLSSRLIPRMLSGLSPLGLVGLGVLPGPLRYPLGIAHPLLAPSDYDRLRVGVQQSRLASETFRALGATPVWFAAGSPSSISTFGGIEQGVSGVLSGKLEEIGRYLTANVVLWPRPLVVFASPHALSKLTAAERAVLAEAVSDDIAPETRLAVEGERSATAGLCRSHGLRFLTATGAELAAMRRAVLPVYTALERSPQTRAAIAAIEAMRHRVSPEARPSCAPAGVSTAARDSLDGVYGDTITLAELRASGADPSSLVPENYGTLRLVIDRGHFAQTQQDAGACTWGYGTESLKGDTFRWLYINGGGIAPTNSTNKPGELAVWRWSLYRDKLRLAPASPGPATLTLTRISTTPSAHYLSNRCPPPANALPR
jgi:TRAP-type C4-dicarboxylate transport system substrate-binding protein